MSTKIHTKYFGLLIFQIKSIINRTLMYLFNMEYYNTLKFTKNLIWYFCEPLVYLSEHRETILCHHRRPRKPTVYQHHDLKIITSINQQQTALVAQKWEMKFFVCTCPVSGAFRSTYTIKSSFFIWNMYFLFFKIKILQPSSTFCF